VWWLTAFSFYYFCGKYSIQLYSWVHNYIRCIHDDDDDQVSTAWIDPQKKVSTTWTGQSHLGTRTKLTLTFFFSLSKLTLMLYFSNEATLQAWELEKLSDMIEHFKWCNFLQLLDFYEGPFKKRISVGKDTFFSPNSSYSFIQSSNTIMFIKWVPQATSYFYVIIFLIYFVLNPFFYKQTFHN